MPCLAAACSTCAPLYSNWAWLVQTAMPDSYRTQRHGCLLPLLMPAPLAQLLLAAAPLLHGDGWLRHHG